MVEDALDPGLDPLVEQAAATRATAATDTHTRRRDGRDRPGADARR
jgi:hypothetical protein